MPEYRQYKKILCMSFYPATGPSARHRIIGYQREWEKAGLRLVFKAFLTKKFYENRRESGALATLYKLAMFSFCTMRLLVRLPTVAFYEAVIIHREVFPLGPSLFEALIIRLAKATYYDLDDAVWTVMPLKVDQRKLLRDTNRVSEIMKRCDAVVAGNEYIKRYAAKFNPHVVIIPTPYSGAKQHQYSVQNEDDHVPVIVWIGNVGNEEYLDVLREPLSELARKHRFRLRIIGSAEAAAFTVPGVDIEHLVWNAALETIWLAEADIGIMPLFDREYERGKCSFKIIQYFASKLPVVASPVGMNCEVVENGINGFLASEGHEWQEALGKLIANAAMREQFGEAGFACYQARFTPEVTAESWITLLSTDR